MLRPGLVVAINFMAYQIECLDIPSIKLDYL